MADDLSKIQMGSVRFLATLTESIEKSNRLVEHNVEEGFPLTQVARVMPRTGSVDLVLVDSLFTTSLKETQKRALDRLFDIKAQGKPVRYQSPLDQVSATLIESIAYKRDKYRNRWLATIQWREVRISQTVVGVVVYQGRIDPGTQLPTDPPSLDRGYVAPVPQPTTQETTTGSTGSKGFWASIWGWL